MKKTILLLMLISSTISSIGQEIATFKEATNRSETSEKQTEYSVPIIIPKPKDFLNYKITLQVNIEKTTLSLDSIYLPANQSFTIKEDTKTTFFTIKFNSDAKDDKILVLRLVGSDATGKSVDLKSQNPEHQILVKPRSRESSFWMYTGTNLDLVDGPKLKELYFKGSFLTKLSNKYPQYWLYVTFGKNRFSSANDSVMQQSFSELDIMRSHPDSLYIKSGYYKSVYEQITDNLFGSFSFLFQLEQSTQSRTFLTTGMYFGLQTIKTSHKNTVLTTDTKALPRPPINTITRLYPIVISNTERQFNYNFSVGGLHKFTNDKYDVKVELNLGYNRFFYPQYRKITPDPNENNTLYAAQNNAYVQIRMEGTVLNPGLSVGFETFIRNSQVPLYNISLTKVIDLTNLGSIFGKVSPSL